MGVGTPQKKWLRHDWVGGSLREKIIHFILAPSETYLLARFDPLVVTILETLAVITSAGYAPRANLVIYDLLPMVIAEIFLRGRFRWHIPQIGSQTAHVALY